MKNLSINYLLAPFLITATILFRLQDHFPNVAPVAAISLWAGTYLAFPWCFLVPITAMLIADSIIGFASLPVTLSVYFSFVLIAVLGTWMRTRCNTGKIIISSLAGSTLFYLITNAAVWKFSNLYPFTFDGLFLSYYYALPFFRNTLLGDMAFTGGLFTVWIYVPRLVAKRIPKISSEKFHRKKTINNIDESTAWRL